MGWCSSQNSICFFNMCDTFLYTSKRIQIYSGIGLYFLLDCYGICPVPGIGVPDLSIPEKIGHII